MATKYSKILVGAMIIAVGVGVYKYVKSPNVQKARQERLFYKNVRSTIDEHQILGNILQTSVIEAENIHYMMYYDANGIYIKDFVNPDIELVKVDQEYDDCGYALMIDSLGGFFVETGYYASKIKVSLDEDYHSYGDEIASVIKYSANNQHWSNIKSYEDHTVIIKVDKGVYYMASRYLQGKLVRLYTEDDYISYCDASLGYQHGIVDNRTNKVIEKDSVYGFSIVVKTRETMPEIFHCAAKYLNDNSPYAEQRLGISSSLEVESYFVDNWKTGMYTRAKIGFDSNVVGREAYCYISNVDNPSAVENIYSEDIYFMCSDIRNKLLENPELKLKDLLTETTYGDWMIDFEDDGFGEKLITKPYCLYRSNNVRIEIYPYKVVDIQSPYLRSSFFTYSALNKIKVQSKATNEAIYITPSLFSNKHNDENGRFSISYDDDVSKLLNLFSQGDLTISIDVTNSAFLIDSNSSYEIDVTHDATDYYASIKQMVEIYNTVKEVYN